MAGRSNGFGLWLDLTLDNRGPGAARRLAKEIGVSDGAVTQWRKEPYRQPSARNVQDIARALDVDPMRLLVTAGHLDSSVVGAEPYEIPESERTLHEMKKALERDGVMTKRDVAAILDNYSNMRRKRTDA